MKLAMFAVATLLLLGPFSYFTVTAAEGNDYDRDLGPAQARAGDDWKVVKAGTVISISKSGNQVNNSHYFPLPFGATVLSGDIVISPLPYTAGGTDLPENVKFNIGNAPREYTYDNETLAYQGAWGRQYLTRDGLNNSGTVNIQGGGEHVLRFELPKNATVTDATIGITGYQRDVEFMSYRASGASSGDRYGSVVHGIGDLDSDGYDEVLYSAPHENFEAGAVYELYYEPTDETFYISDFAAGTASFAHFGSSLAGPTPHPTASDNLIVIGSPTDQLDDKGSVFLYGYRGQTLEDTLTGNESNELFGSAVAVADIDSDKVGELMVGSPEANGGKGKVYILDIGDQTHPFSALTSLRTVINGSTSDTSFGRSIAVGDMNGDGTMDIVIGSDQEVKLYLGGSSFDIAEDAAFDPLADSGLSMIGQAKFLGDTLGNGRETLGIGCPATSGKVVIYDGSSTVNTVADLIIASPATSVNFGSSLDGDYDRDRDGDMEFAVLSGGSPTVPGRVSIYTRAQSAPLSDFSAMNISNLYGDLIDFGSDLRNDGCGDVFVGLPEFQGTNNYGRGIVRLFEWFDMNRLPKNTPILSIGGTEVWRYSGDHFSTDIVTADLSAYFNQAITSSAIDYSTPFDSFVSIPLKLTCTTNDKVEHSTEFYCHNYSIAYDEDVEISGIADAFNSYTEMAEVDADGTVHVPFSFAAETPGKMVIDSISLDLDLVPYIEPAVTPVVHIDEDAIVPKALDLYAAFGDDNSADNIMTYSVETRGDNLTKIAVNISQGRYLVVDAFTGSQNDNWTGEVELRFIVTDGIGGRFVTDDIKVSVDPKNDAPAVKGAPDTTVVQDKVFFYTPFAIDDEGDVVMYNVSGPENLTVDEMGTVTWTPNAWQVGDNDWTLTLSDGMDNRTYSFFINVVNVEDKPYFETPAPVNASVLVGETFQYTFKAVDVDPGDKVTYQLVEGPLGSFIGSTSGELTWTPDIYLYDPQQFIVRATDLTGRYADLEFNMRTSMIDDPPVIGSKPVKQHYDMIKWTYHISISDPDGDGYTVDLAVSPEGMGYDDFSETFFWKPTADQVGAHNVSIRVNSTRYLVYQNFTITVLRSVRSWTLSLDGYIDGDVVSGVVRLGGSVTVEPSEVLWVEVRVGNGTWKRAGLISDTWSFDLATDDFKDGEHIVQVRAWDGWNYSTPEEISLVFENEDEPVSIGLVLVIVIVVILILLLIGGLVFLMLKIKQKAEKEELVRQHNEALRQSQTSMRSFLDTASVIKVAGPLPPEQTLTPADQSRLSSIDELFAPLNVPKEQEEYVEEIPEDPLEKGKVAELHVPEEYQVAPGHEIGPKEPAA